MGSEGTKRISAAQFDQYIERRRALDPAGRLLAKEGTVAPGWQWFYAYGKDQTDPAKLERYQAGVLAYKKRLIAANFGTGIKLEVKIWGGAARDRTKDLQRSLGITADGVVGPRTGKELARPIVVKIETKYHIPDHLLGKQGSLESNNHVVAEGYVDPEDEGWAQVHLPFHPEITLAQAWDLDFSITWAGGQLWSNHANLGDWDAAVAAYNVGYFTAKQWLAAGKPASGGPIWHTQFGDIDSWARAHEYVQLVRSVPY